MGENCQYYICYMSDRDSSSFSWQDSLCGPNHSSYYTFYRRYRLSLYHSLLSGDWSCFLALCDVLSRYINFPFETPIGVVTAFIGIPFFLYLIRVKGESSVDRSKIQFSRYMLTLLVFILLTLVAGYFHLTNGVFDMSVMDVIKTLLRIDPNPKFDLVIFQFRLPRIIIASLVGIGLGMAGTVIQGITRNGLADPGILGINAGAGAAIVAFMFFFQMSGVTFSKKAGSRY